MFEKWCKLPEVIRWILFFPTAFISVMIIGFILRILILSGGMLLYIFNLVFPPLMGVIGLFLIFQLVPKKKYLFVIIFIILRSFFIPIFVLKLILLTDKPDVDFSWDEYWSPFIGEILTLFFSVWLYDFLKSENSYE